ncbi:MAG: DUF4159 domain-containing protein [Hasllibacter sp.]
MTIGPVAFAAPFLLLALIVLPILWLILRAVPPAPIRRRFPGVALLLGLRDEETVTDRTPWWLMLIRMLALAAVIVGLAGPVLNPREGAGGSGPLLIVADASWASAPDWPARVARIEAALEEAARDGRPAVVVPLTRPQVAPAFSPADGALAALPGLEPSPWAPDYAAFEAPEGTEGTLWISDGIARDGRADLLARLEALGPVEVAEAPGGVLALAPPAPEAGETALRVLRPGGGPAREVRVVAEGPDPAGAVRALASGVATFEEGATEAEALLDLPSELLARVQRFEVAGVRSAGAVQLADDGLRRREIAVLGPGEAEALVLLSPEHYLREALAPVADLIEGDLATVIPANPDAIVLADAGRIAEAEALEDWVRGGGTLIRFAGPRMAASEAGVGRDDPLLPVRLRAGGRTVGGAMSWGEPKALRPFDPEGPFAGLEVPDEVRVSAQVVAEPGPALAGATIAALEDGTPLVTAAPLGEGRVVLFHVSANAEWSGLPLSGLFVRMLDRLALGAGGGREGAADLEGTVLVPEVALDAFGAARDAGDRPGVAGEDVAAALADGPDAMVPPGLYAGDGRAVAVPVIGPGAALTAADWPSAPGPVEIDEEVPLGGWLLAAALALLALDALAAMWLGGRLRGAAAAALLGPLMLLSPGAAEAQEAAEEAPFDAQELLAASDVALAYVVTGDPSVDEISEAGLFGLSRTLFERTSVEPRRPVGVVPGEDELGFYPLLYWPVTADQPTPGPAARAALNAYLRGGGMIVFDTRDAGFRGGGTTPEGRALQRIAAGLDIPPLERLPEDHVLTRAFYLLQDFPGRFNDRDVWVEASPPDAEQAEGMPFRNLNDNVTPVLIGGNDWAAAWAMTDAGRPMLRIGRGPAGERQREIALRFGVNLVMHVLSGNYKSDQVHVPALLDRLGN